MPGRTVLHRQMGTQNGALSTPSQVLQILTDPVRTVLHGQMVTQNSALWTPSPFCQMLTDPGRTVLHGQMVTQNSALWTPVTISSNADGSRENSSPWTDGDTK